MGERLNMSLDTQIMPYIDMANLACGFHAGDPVTMHRSIKDAKANGVRIGAHPSYHDLKGFGRREMRCSEEEVIALVLYQLGALDGICKFHDTSVSYLKPHGALYNMMMKDLSLFTSICKAVSKYDTNIKLMILATTQNEPYVTLAKKFGISLLYEVFADRAYRDDGSLVPRSQDGAVLHSEKEILKRARLLRNEGYIETINGLKLPLEADTLCVHGDNAQALTLIQALHQP